MSNCRPYICGFYLSVSCGIVLVTTGFLFIVVKDKVARATAHSLQLRHLVEDEITPGKLVFHGLLLMLAGGLVLLQSIVRCQIVHDIKTCPWLSNQVNKEMLVMLFSQRRSDSEDEAATIETERRWQEELKRVSLRRDTRSSMMKVPEQPHPMHLPLREPRRHRIHRQAAAQEGTVKNSRQTEHSRRETQTSEFDTISGSENMTPVKVEHQENCSEKLIYPGCSRRLETSVHTQATHHATESRLQAHHKHKESDRLIIT